MAPVEDRIEFGILSEDPGFFCRLAQLEFFEAFFEDMQDLDLRPAEMSVILTIGENPGVRQGVLAQALKIKRSAMTKMMRGLESRGYVSRVSPDNDLRSIELVLTQSGRDLFDKATARMREHRGTVTTRLSPDEMASLLVLLKKFIGFNA